MASAAAPFTQLVSFVTRSPAERDQLLSAWHEATSFVVSSERGSVTHTYELFLPTVANQPPFDQAPKQPNLETEIVALETYDSKGALDEKHMPSPPIASFLSAAKGAKLSLRFLTHKAGFHWRGQEREDQIRAEKKKPHTLVVTMDFASPEILNNFVAHASAQFAAVEANEPNALTYELYSSRTDLSVPESQATQLIVFERYVTLNDLATTHVQAPYFAVFDKAVRTDEKIKPLRPWEIMHYEEQAVGFVGKV